MKPLSLCLLAALFIALYSATAAAVDPRSIKTVHVVFSNHLDVGFSDGSQPGTIINVVNTYLSEYFLKAVNTSQSLRARGGKERYIWTTHSWLVSLFLDCPPVPNLKCPSEADKQAFLAAVERGDVTWHAYPFNSEIELVDASLFEFGIQLTHELDDRVKKPRKRVMSQRDVPGITRSAIPILLKNGVEAVSIGVNGASAPYDVPTAFVWENPVSAQSIVTLYHPGGYGGIELADAVLVDGLDVALVMDWRGDNAGPADPDEVIADFASVQAIFPNATVVASTFDDYIGSLLAVKSSLPVLKSEGGDTWIYGVSSDPLKNAQIRALTRARTACLDQKLCSLSSFTFRNFSRFLLKGAETFYNAYSAPDYYQWSNAEFQAVRQSPSFQGLEATWKEQRTWAVDAAVQALGNHPLANHVRAELAQLDVRGPPSLTGYTVVANPSATLPAGRFQVSFNTSTGAISSLVDVQTGTHWASADHNLGRFLYQTFTEYDFNDFMNQYMFLDANQTNWAHYDFGKVNVTNANPVRQDRFASLAKLYTKTNATAGTIHYIVQLSMDASLVQNYGAPAAVYVQYDFPPATAANQTASSIGATVTWVNKTATRLPESLWFEFTPYTDPEATASKHWFFNKLDEWVSLDDVFVNGSSHLTNVWDGVLLSTHRDSLHIRSLDTGLVSYGFASPFPTPFGVPSSKEGVFFSLCNNIWGTNYVMYYDEDAVFRFSLSLV